MLYVQMYRQFLASQLQISQLVAYQKMRELTNVYMKGGGGEKRAKLNVFVANKQAPEKSHNNKAKTVLIVNQCTKKLKIKIKFYEDKINTSFYDDDMPKEDS